MNTLNGHATVETSVQARDVQMINIQTNRQLHLPVPHQLRPLPATFTDRTRMLREVTRRLADQPRVSVRIISISGVAGVGKTTFATRLLHDLSDEFPGGQLQVDLRGYSPKGQATMAETLGRLLRAMWSGELCGDVEELTAWWRSITAERQPIALLIDNAVRADHVRALLPGGQGHVVVATSRNVLLPLVQDGATFCRLPPLGPAATQQLLTRCLGTKRLTDSEIRQLATRTAGIPLAVTVTATHLATPYFTGRNEDMNHSWLGAQSTPDQPDRDTGEPVVMALDSACEALDADAARVYRLSASLATVDFDADMIAAVFVLPREQAAATLETLASARLLEELGHQPCRGPIYKFHDAVRDHAVGQVRVDAARDEAARRLLDWYLTSATAAEQRLTPSHSRLPRDYVHPPTQLPFTNDVEAQTWLDFQHGNLMLGVRFANASGMDSMAWQLVHAMWPWWRSHHNYLLWDEAHAIACRAASRCHALEAERVLLNTWGVGLRSSGRHQDAVELFCQVLALADAARDQRMQAQALHELGSTQYAMGRTDDAERFLARAHRMRVSLGDQRGVALTEVCLGQIRLDAGQLAEAIDHFTNARATLVAKDPFDAARALAWMGRAHARLSNFPRATQLLERAKAEFGEISSPRWIARTLDMLGQTAEEQGHFSCAIRLYKASLEQYEHINLRDAERVRRRLRILEE